jgi:glutamine synthetase
MYWRGAIEEQPGLFGGGGQRCQTLPCKRPRTLLCRSLTRREALDSLDQDRVYLKAGGVMNDDMIDAYIELRMAENMRYEMTPHPVEYDMYYSV